MIRLIAVVEFEKVPHHSSQAANLHSVLPDAIQPMLLLAFLVFAAANLQQLHMCEYQLWLYAPHSKHGNAGMDARWGHKKARRVERRLYGIVM